MPLVLGVAGGVLDGSNEGLARNDLQVLRLFEDLVKNDPGLERAW
jgi:hypothetical protein